MSHLLRAVPASGRVMPMIALALLSGCASTRYERLEEPRGTRALGLEFGATRADTEVALRAAGIPARGTPADPDALVADRCPGAPVRGPCRLLFGPLGLYAAELEAPAADADALARAVSDGLGAPSRTATVARPGAPVLVGAWERPGWTIAVTRGGPGGAAGCRVGRDAAAPPVVAGVPLGRLRGDVEHALDAQGATVVERVGGSSTYLGCPQGSTDALSCVVSFRGGRAAAVTEILPAVGDDAGALSSWKILARRYERDIGRAPETACPADGPDRVGGDCTATWRSDRLVVIVGAHRVAGARHRGAISVYTSFTYPPLGARAEGEGAEGLDGP